MSHPKHVLFHGISDFFGTKHLVSRIIWGIVLLTCWSLSIRGMWAVLGSYQETPTSISMTSVWPEKMPELVYCPVNWASEAKMHKLGMNYNLFVFLNCLQLHSRLSTNSCATIANPNQTLVEMQDVLTLNNISLAQLMDQIAYDESEVLELSTPGWNYTVHRHVNALGVCYVATVIETLDMFSLMTQPVVLKLFSLQRAFQEWSNYPFADERLFLGEHGRGLYPLPEIPILRNHYHYSVRITGEKVVRLPELLGTSCSDDVTLRHQFTCIYKCMNVEFQSRNACALFNPAEVQPISSICSRYRMLPWASLADSKKFFLSCFDRCQQPCTTWHYMYAIGVAGFLENASDPAFVSIGFENPFSTFKHVEQNNYGIDRFVSDIGGQLSLWSGGSIVSLFQIVYLLAAAVYFKARREKLDISGSEERGEVVKKKSLAEAIGLKQ